MPASRCPHMQGSIKSFGLAAASATLFAALGCSGFVSTAVDPVVAADVPVRGTVHGGQQPVTGSHLYLYAVGTGGYGSAATSILKAQTGATKDASGNYYVTTDSGGNFAFSSFTCPTKTATQTYLLAVGGNPGYVGTVNNTAIAALVSTGKCGSIGANSVFAINELTTVATITAVQQFMVDGTHIGGSGALPVGLKIAFNLAGDLVNTSTGVANTVNAMGDGAIPTPKINALGNVIAPCLNATSPTDTACTSLFAAVTPTGGTQPSNTIGAMLLIAQNPGNNVNNVFGQATATPPFQPTIAATSPPNDLTLAITYTGGGMTAPSDVVIDAAGDAFIGNAPSGNGAAGTDSIVGFGPDGTVLTGAAGYTSGIHKPNALAFDRLGNLWSTDTASGSSPDEVVKLSSTGTLAFAFNDTTIAGLEGIALDSSNNAWVVNQNNSSIDQILANGTRTLAPVASSGFQFPTGIGIDGSGVLFAAGTGSNTLLKFDSSGAVQSPAGGYAPNGLSQPVSISIDASDHVFTINNNSSLITEINGGDGSLVAPPATPPTLSNAYVLAIDGAGGAWYANCRACSSPNNGSPDNLVHVAPNGTQASGTADGYQDAHLNYVGTAAIDGAGNVWVTSNGAGGTGSVTEFLGVAAPVVTPLAVASATNTLGIRP